MMLVLKRAKARDWAAGSEQIRAFDKKKSDRWSVLDKLSHDKSSRGLLSYARALANTKDTIFFPEESYISRSIKFRWGDLERAKLPAEKNPYARRVEPIGPDEETKLRVLLFDADQSFYALQAYAAYFKVANLKSSEAKKAIKEADKVYNRLLNWDHIAEAADEYSKRLNADPAVAEIRRAGEAIRKG